MSEGTSIGIWGGGRGGGEGIEAGSKQGKESRAVMEGGARVMMVLLRTKYGPHQQKGGNSEGGGGIRRLCSSKD